jgi:hypothetical protein
MGASGVFPETRQGGGQVTLKRASAQSPLPEDHQASSHLANLTCMPAATTHWIDIPKGSIA